LVTEIYHREEGRVQFGTAASSFLKLLWIWKATSRSVQDVQVVLELTSNPIIPDIFFRRPNKEKDDSLPSRMFNTIVADSLQLIRRVDLDFKALRLIRLKQLKRCTGLLTLNIIGQKRPAPYRLRNEQSESGATKAALRSDAVSILRMPAIYLTKGNITKLSTSNINVQ
jgi:hypothetical protein